MWDTSIGQKAPDFFVIGTASMPLYLYRFNEGWALFEGGLAVMGTLVLSQLKTIVGDLSSVRYWFINHAHYDHCALVPYLIRHLPHAEIIASERAAQAFRSARAQHVVKTLNEQVAGNWPGDSQVLEDATAWEDLPIRTIADGETLPLGEHASVRAIATPGHSRCSMSYFIEPRGLLLVSDALGEIVGESEFFPLIFDDAAAYGRSLEKLAVIRPHTIALGHHGLLTGASASSAADHAIAGLERFKASVLSRADRTEDGITRLAEDLTQDHWKNSSDFLPKELHRKSMIRMLELLQQ